MECELERLEEGFRYALYVDGRLILTTRTYQYRRNAELAVKRIGWICRNIYEVSDLGDLPRVVLEKTPGRGYRFCVLARNGTLMAVSPEFDREGKCRAHYRRFHSRLIDEMLPE